MSDRLTEQMLEEEGYFVLDVPKQATPLHKYTKLFLGEDRGFCGVCGLKPGKCKGTQMTPPSPKTPLETFEAALAAGMIYAVEHAYIHAYIDGRYKDPLVLDDQEAAIRKEAIAYKDAEVRAETIKLLTMNLSDASFAAGQLKGFTGKQDVYWQRRTETLSRQLAALQNPDESEVK